MEYAEILTGIRKIVRVINLESKQLERKYQISIPQLLCLKFISEQQQYQSYHKDIKNYLQLNASTVTGIINRLERKGLIAKLPKKGDMRAIPIVLTATGVELLRTVPEPLHTQICEHLKTLPQQKIAELEKAFSLIVKFLDESYTDASPIVTAEISLNPADNDTELS